MPKIMEQRGSQRFSRTIFVKALCNWQFMMQIAKAPNETRHHVRSSERM